MSQFLLDYDKLFFYLKLKKNRCIDKYMISLNFTPTFHY